MGLHVTRDGESTRGGGPIDEQFVANPEPIPVEEFEGEMPVASRELEADFGQGVRRVTLTRDPRGFDAVTFTGITDCSDSLRIPSEFKPKALAVRDVDDDGDLDLLVQIESAFLVYSNLHTVSDDDEDIAELALDKYLETIISKGIEDFTGSAAVAIASRLLGEEDVAEKIAEKFDEFEELDVRDFSDQVPKRLEHLFSNFDPEKLHPLFRLWADQGDSYHDRLFFTALTVLKPDQGARLVKKFSPGEVATSFCRLSDSHPNETKSLERDGLSKSLDALSRNGDRYPEEISSSLACAPNYTLDRFPGPGISGFMEWFLRDQSPARAVKYLEALSGSPRRGEAEEIINALKDGFYREGDDQVWVQGYLDILIRNDFPHHLLEQYNLRDRLRGQLKAAIDSGNADEFAFVDGKFLEWFLNDVRPTPEEVAVLANSLRSKPWLGMVVFKLFGPAFTSRVIVPLARRSVEAASRFTSGLMQKVVDESRDTGEDFDFGQVNPILAYQIIRDLPEDVLVPLLSLQRDSDDDEFRTKAALLTWFESDRPEVYRRLLKRLRGPFVGNEVSPMEAASRIEEYANDWKAIRSILVIFGSTYLPKAYLEATFAGLSDGLKEKIRARKHESPKGLSYAISRQLGDEPLRQNPESVHHYLIFNPYQFDPAVTEQILGDLMAMESGDFVKAARAFRQSSDRFWEMQDQESWDATGLGWIYRHARSIGNTQKTDLLSQSSDGYFDQVDFLREAFGLDIDLYRMGPFERPLTREELEPIARELFQMSPEKINSIPGITILDATVGHGVLGVHDTFGNIILPRGFDSEVSRQSLRIEGLSFLGEIVTHEAWHANEKDLTDEEFALYARCAGYRRSDLYYRDYEIIGSREMVSPYHTNIFEEFAEAGTNFEENGVEFRQRALVLLEKGDPYLALEYLFFKIVPEETRGQEFPVGRAIPENEQVTNENVAGMATRLHDNKVIDDEKYRWIRKSLQGLQEHQAI